MKFIFFSGLLITLFASCSEGKITITSEYIINENWSKKGEDMESNTIEVKKMCVKKDSLINPFIKLSQKELLDKLENDSSFNFVANVKIKSNETYLDKKIYFNQENSFYWYADKGEKKKKIIGKLEQGSWYEISRLSNSYYIIYVDSTDDVHPFIINAAKNF